MVRQVDAFLSFHGAEFSVVTAYATLTEPTGRAPRPRPAQAWNGTVVVREAAGNLTFQ
jgi:hypothetical protein